MLTLLGDADGIRIASCCALVFSRRWLDLRHSTRDRFFGNYGIGFSVWGPCLYSRTADVPLLMQRLLSGDAVAISGVLGQRWSCRGNDGKRSSRADLAQVLIATQIPSPKAADAHLRNASMRECGILSTVAIVACRDIRTVGQGVLAQGLGVINHRSGLKHYLR